MESVRPYPGFPDEPTWKRPLYSTAYRPKPPDAHFYLPAGEKVVKFIRLLHHYKGAFGISPENPTGMPFDLLDWQKHEVIIPLFGWKTLARARDEYGAETDERVPCAARSEATPDGNLVVEGVCTCPRMYRGLYNETPKKQGKTQLGAGIGGYMAFADGEPAADVFTYAADREQAKLAFDALSFGMFYEGNPFEDKGCKPMARSIKNDRTKSSVKVQSSSVGTKHGPNAHCIIFDELHAQPNRDLWDVTTAGVASRTQPIVAALTTAGWDRLSVCWEQHEYARQIAEGVYDDPSFLGVIYGAPEDADWTSPEVWHLASPSLGITVSVDFIAAECREAIAMPTAQNSFRQLYLSQWTQQAVRFIDLAKWDMCSGPLLLKPRLICYGGLDLAATTDLAAWALIFPQDDETWDIKVQYYIPAENIRARALRDRVPYQLWVDQGFITATPGDVIAYDFIKQDILKDRGEYLLKEIGYDPWNAVQFVNDLEEHERLKLFPMTQGYKSLSPPTKELLRIIIEQKLRHGGNPVLRWNVDSAAATTDASANVKLDKSKSTARIDGLAATVMALYAALLNPTKKRRSIYERDDIDPGAMVSERKEGTR